MIKRRLIASFSAFLFALALSSWAVPVLAGPGITNPCPPGEVCPEGPGFGTYFANSPAGSRTYGGITYYTGVPLRKFVDALPGLCAPNVPSAGNNCIPVAVPDTTTYPGDDYYVIGLKDFSQQLHLDLPKNTAIRGYYQVNNGTALATDHNPVYDGPMIVAKSGTPVRVLFRNELSVGTAGNLPIPVDTHAMGAGQCPTDPPGGMYTQNRAVVHLHGGNTPWISDGTPRQWTTPIGENTTTCLKGDSFQNVPDMIAGPGCAATGNPGACITPALDDGVGTYFYTNQQSSRMMFYHDHAYGTTRLDVYAGEAAGYLIYDEYELDLINGTNTMGANPGMARALPDLSFPTGNPYYKYGIPLIIQDKTFVPWDVDIQDSLWNRDGLGNPRHWGQTGDFWFPHVYEPNQMPLSIGGANPFGRWDYGPWFWPPVPVDPAYSVLPEPSQVPEAFMDTPVINGKAYPYADVQPMPYRFRILNAANDRAVNLSLFVAEPLHISVTAGGSGYTAPPAVSIAGGGCTGLSATATISNGTVTGITITNRGAGYTTVPAVTISGGGGSGATAEAFMELGVVKQIVVTNGGSGYTSVPTVTIDVPSTPPPSGVQALATAQIIQGGVVTGVTVSGSGSCTSNPTISLTTPSPGPGTQAKAVASINTEVRMVPAVPHTVTSVPPLCAETTVTRDAGLAIASLDPVTYMPINGTGLPSNCWPTSWPVDSRDGGVPDPLTAGPAMIQVGNEGGFLPAPVAIPPTPVGYDYNRRNIVVLNVLNKGVFLQPAERADVIVDFSAFAGKTVILYNDAPAPMPGFDPRFDYYTDDPDYSTSGGAPSTRAGEGPNIRTMMQFRVAASAPALTRFDMTALKTALPATFSASQPTPHVPETAYPAPNTAAADTYARIEDYSLTFTPLGLDALWRVNVTSGGTGYTLPPTVGFVGGDGTGAKATATVSGGIVTGVIVTSVGTGYTTPPTGVNFTGGGGTGAAATVTFEPQMIAMQSKAIQELWDPWGRMNATLGVELPFTNNNIQTTIPLGYIDPPTEIVPEGQVQLWKITHNGVDTHPVHVHLYNAQVINRVGWDGAIRPPEDNELGWKETIRMNPLEDVIIALQPKTQTGLPFVVPLSSHLLDTTNLAGAPITVLDPFGTLGGGNPGNPITIANPVRDFGWEYVWHCHILGHEENDFMRPFIMLVPDAVPPAVPSTPPGPPAPFAATPAGNSVQLTWVDDSPLHVDSNTPDRNAKIGYRIERCTDPGGGCTNSTDYAPIAKVLASCMMPPPQTTLPPVWPCNYDTAHGWVNYNYTDSLVVPGATYKYRIVAYNAFGDSTEALASAAVAGVPPATGVTLIPDQPSPHLVGTAVKFTAGVAVPDPAYQYRFWLAVGAGAPSIVQDYSYTDNWSLPATTLPGSYTVSVDVRSNLASTTPDPGATASFADYLFVLPSSVTGIARIQRTLTNYGTLTEAFAAANPQAPSPVDGDVIQAIGVVFSSEPGGNLPINIIGAATLSGGWDPAFNSNAAMTTLQGSLTVTTGSLTVDKLTIQ